MFCLLAKQINLPKANNSSPLYFLFSIELKLYFLKAFIHIYMNTSQIYYGKRMSCRNNLLLMICTTSTYIYIFFFKTRSITAHIINIIYNVSSLIHSHVCGVQYKRYIYICVLYSTIINIIIIIKYSMQIKKIYKQFSKSVFRYIRKLICFREFCLFKTYQMK